MPRGVKGFQKGHPIYTTRGKFRKGNTPWNKGEKGLYHHTEEWKRKMSLIMSGKKHPLYGKHHSEETKQRMKKNHWSKKENYINPMKGKHRSEELKKQMCLANKGKHHSLSTEFKKGHIPWNRDIKRIHLSPKTEFKKGFIPWNKNKKGVMPIPWNKGKSMPKEIKEKVSKSRKGKGLHPKEWRIRMSKLSKERWKDPEYVKKIASSQHKKPNKHEEVVDKLIQTNFPNKFLYTGDGKHGTSIGGKIPDWLNVNGEKKVIEYFGTYWHKPNKWRNNLPYHQTYDGTIDHYKKYGFDCLIIWKEELKDLERIIEKIRDWR